MSKITIELEYEQIDAIVLKELKNCLKGVKKDMERAAAGKGYHHPSDVEQYPKDAEALKRVIALYTVQGES